MNTRLQRFARISAAVLALAGGLAAISAPARADLPVLPIFILKLPDLIVTGPEFGKMLNPADGKTIPALIVRVKNIGNAAAPASKTFIKVIYDGTPMLPGPAVAFLVDTPPLAVGEDVALVVPGSSNVCGFYSFTADAANTVAEWHEDNNTHALFIDCFHP